MSVAVIKQRVLIRRGDQEAQLPALRQEECGKFSQYQVQIEPATMYDALLELDLKEDEFDRDGEGQEGPCFQEEVRRDGNHTGTT